MNLQPFEKEQSEAKNLAHSSIGECTSPDTFSEFLGTKKNGDLLRIITRNARDWSRKTSMDSQLSEGKALEDDHSLKNELRRFSVPEKDYAIMRHCRERRFEVIAAFDKHADPYKSYMKSLVCYDLAPSHGAIVLIDGSLMMRKALSVLHQSNKYAGTVINTQEGIPIGILTISDCLRAVVLAASDKPEIEDISVKEFVQSFGRNKIITISSDSTIWDAARLFCLNHVHHIPVLHTDESSMKTDIILLLTLRMIFTETFLKLTEPSNMLIPRDLQRTLGETALGSWGQVISVYEETLCSEVLHIFVNLKVSCLAVLGDHDRLIGKISKNDIMKELTLNTDDHLRILSRPVKNVFHACKPAFPNATIHEAICLLLETDDQCIFIVNTKIHKPIAAVAFVDIMEYILNPSDIHQKKSI